MHADMVVDSALIAHLDAPVLRLVQPQLGGLSCRMQGGTRHASVVLGRAAVQTQRSRAEADSADTDSMEPRRTRMNKPWQITNVAAEGNASLGRNAAWEDALRRLG